MFLDVGSLPPRAWNVKEDINVDSCEPFPPREIGTRVSVVIFDYTNITGGRLEPFEVISTLSNVVFSRIEEKSERGDDDLPLFPSSPLPLFCPAVTL
jgi:hypothetical protein